MQKYKNWLLTHWPLAVCLLLQLIIFRKWVFSVDILTHGDWWNLTDATMQSMRIAYFNTWLPDLNFGRVLIDLGQAPTYALYGLLSQLFGFSFAINERLIHMLPIVLLSPVGIYLLLKQSITSRLAIFCGMLVYLYNTYILIIVTGHLTLGAAFSFMPLLLFVYMRALSYPRTHSLLLCLLSTILLFIMSCYEPRAAFVATGVLTIYTFWRLVLHQSVHSRLWALAIYGFLILVFCLLSAFWIIPMTQSSAQDSATIMNRGLFGSQYFTLQHALTLHHPYWNYSKPVAFVAQQIPVFFWLTPLYIVSAMLALRHAPRKMYFFGLLVIVGVLFAKHANAPFSKLYPWAFSHIPLFNAFRESSKFYIIITLAAAMLIAYAVQAGMEVSKRKLPFLPISIKKGAIALPVILLFLSNALPVASGKVGTLFIKRRPPAQYSTYNAFVASSKEFSRVLWTPISSRWADNTQHHPNVNLVDMANTTWKPYVQPVYVDRPTSAEGMMSILQNEYSYQLLSQASVGFIVVPLRDTENDDDFFIHYGDDRDYYIQQLDKITWLKKSDIKTKDLAVYKVERSNDLFTASAKLFEVENQDLLSNYNLTNYLGTDKTGLVVTRNNQLIDKPGIERFNNILNNISPSDYKNGRFKRTFKTKQKSDYQLVINNAINYWSYTTTPKKITFSKQTNTTVSFNDKALVQPSREPDISIPINPNKQYLFSMGDSLYPVKINNGQKRSVGETKDQINLYSYEEKNLIGNGGFENGAWGSTVEDCNNYGADAKLSMNIANDKDTNHTLQLSAANHAACTTSSSINTPGGQPYSIKFKYKIIKGDKAGYELLFNDKKQTKIQREISSIDSEWQTLHQSFDMPSGATSFKVRLLAFPAVLNDRRSIIDYDDVEIIQLKKAASISNEAGFTRIPIGRTDTVNVALDTNQLGIVENIENPSLETGLWEKTVGDCNAYDSSPVLSMKLDENDASQGNKSLQLGAAKHTACTGPPPIKVEEGSKYLLSFDYKTASKYAGYTIAYNTPDKTAHTTYISVNNTDWQPYSDIITIPYDCTEIKLTVYAYGIDNAAEQVVRYDNFAFHKLPANLGKYFLVSQADTLVPPSSVKTLRNTPTEKHVKIYGATSSFFLNMSETYHKGWILRDIIQDRQSTLFSQLHPPKQIVAEDAHYKLNNHLNTWYIDPKVICNKQPTLCEKNSDGSYNMTLNATFTPQRWLQIGLFISIMTLCGTMICIIILLRKTLRA